MSVAGQVAHDERLASLGTLAASLAHEFNNVLTPAAGWAKLGRRALQEGAPSADDLDRARHAFDRCLAAAERAGDLCRSILEDASPATESADLEQCVRGAIAALPTSPDADGIGVELAITPARIGIGRVAFEHVLLNLLLNARRALLNVADHRRTLHLSSWCEDATVELLVSDSAGGIDSARLPVLFDAFASGEEGGSGLGLTVCRRLVQRVGGTIDVASEVGVGTTFRIRIPAAD